MSVGRSLNPREARRSSSQIVRAWSSGKMSRRSTASRKAAERCSGTEPSEEDGEGGWGRFGEEKSVGKERARGCFSRKSVRVGQRTVESVRELNGPVERRGLGCLRGGIVFGKGRAGRGWFWV